MAARQPAEWTEAHLLRVESRIEVSWCCKLLRWNLFLNDYHPFEPLEVPDVGGHHKVPLHGQQQQLQQPKQRPETDQPETSKHYGRRRGSEGSSSHNVPRHQQHWLPTILKAFNAYFLVKALVLLYLTRSYLHYQLGLGQPGLHFLTRELVYELNSLIGNPIKSLGDVSILIYVSNPGMVAVLTLALPYYYRHFKTMDMSSLRFLLRPRLELRRVDALVELKLDELARSIELSASAEHLAGLQRRAIEIRGGGGGASLGPGRVGRRLDHRALATAYTTRREGTNGRYVHEHRDQLVWLKLNQIRGRSPAGRSQLRPPNYSLQFYEFTWSGYQRFFLIFCGSLAAWYVVSFYVLYHSFNCHFGAEPLVCDSFRLSASFADNWCLLELLLSVWLCYQSVQLHFGLLFLVSVHQLKTIHSIRGQLLECKRQLGQMNESLLAAADHSRRRSSSSFASSSSSAPDDHLVDDEASQRDLLALRAQKAQLMLETLARLAVFEQEIGSMAGCQSEMVAYLYFPVFAQLSYFYLTSQMANSQAIRSLLVRRGATLLVWACTNFASLVCCFVSARLVELEPSYWSILAESARFERALSRWRGRGRQQQQESLTGPPVAGTIASGRRKGSGPAGVDPITRMWQKFVISTHLNFANYCARPLNVSLNYGRLIEFNFFALFYYSLIKKI